MTVEVVCYNIASVAEAIKGGADRIELCASPGDGGTTPSAGMIQMAKAISPVPVYVMIRPRGGDFLYDTEEYEVMKRDIGYAKAQLADGIVLGILTPDGEIDKRRCKELVRLARPMEVTCHRAFDMTRDPIQALRDCIEVGFDRILTSGQQASVADGLELLRRLVKEAANNIVVMPGAGITEANAAKVVSVSRASEIHISGKVFTESEMIFRNPAVSMGNDPREYQKLMVSAARVRQIKEIALRS